MQETRVQSLCRENKRATHSSILAWEIPWTEEPRGLQSNWVSHDTATKQNSNNPPIHDCTVIQKVAPTIKKIIQPQRSLGLKLKNFELEKIWEKNERTFSTDVKHKDDVNFETEKEREEVHCLLTSGNSILAEASKSASGSTNDTEPSWVCCCPGSRSVAWRWGPESATALPPLPGACAKLKAALKEEE